MSEYGVFPGPYFSRISTGYGDSLSPNTGKYRQEKTPYLDSFHVVDKSYYAAFARKWSLNVVGKAILIKKWKRVLSGFKDTFSVSALRKQPPEVLYKTGFSWKFRIIHRKALALESLFDKVADLKAYNLQKECLTQECFSVYTAKSLGTLILKNIYERLFQSP